MINSRLHIVIHGAVQGVGFRPFIYRLAFEMGLKGYISNSTSGVFIEVEGEKEILNSFLLRIDKEKPYLAIINSLEFSFLDPIGYKDFEIKESTRKGEISALILPDISVCKDCLSEMYNPLDRRHLYPFINCTNCGPRYSIIEGLPYDRINTSMKNFEMCNNCRSEYENPLNRRFHAQPIACPECGPKVELWDENGKIIDSKYDAIKTAANYIKNGRIIALKGIGGFQLLADALNFEAIERLRQRKHREEKPFALMFPNIEMVKTYCNVSKFEERILLSPESPIVLLRKANNDKKSTANKGVPAPNIAPNNPYLGIMLPYSPLHHLLMKEIGIPVIATSGNISEEPMCIDEYEALKRLHGIADFYLVHNRPIVRPVDDSIVRIINEREMVLRRARGYAPLPLQVNFSNSVNSKSVIAVGPHLKNTVAISKANNIFISQHIGDLSTNESFEAFVKVLTDLRNIYGISGDEIACDSHPEYLSTKFAKSISQKPIFIQHHHAHIAACRVENQVFGKALGVAWDGTGYGFDGTIWGGEFFIADENTFEHVASFRQFQLPGGEQAVKEPRRTALGILYEIFSDSIFLGEKYNLGSLFSPQELKILSIVLKQNINCPITSSVGRLYDGVASLIGISNFSNYEGQAAMMLEYAANKNEIGSYNFEIKQDLNNAEKGQQNLMRIDWQPMIEEIIEEKNKGVSVSIISKKFHNTLSEIILKIAEITGEKKILLSGGCFQNAVLLENTIRILESQNFNVYWHQRIPPNDGGVSVGQAYLALNGYNEIK